MLKAQYSSDMNNTAFIAAYGESRNGANCFYRHGLARNFHYSDGVRDCAETGCYWLLDMIATEATTKLRASGDIMGIVEVRVADEAATITMTVADDKPPVWKKRITYTDMLAGVWKFYLTDEGSRFALILPSEY
jgi:hypothetical protein